MTSTPTPRTMLLGAALLAALAGTPARVRAAEESPPALPAVAEPDGASVTVEDPASEEAPPPRSRKEIEAEKRRNRVRPHVARSFAEVREHLDAGRYAEAGEELAKVHPKTAPERVQTARLRGYVAFGLQRNDAAIEALREAIADPATLSAADRAEVLFQIAQIQAGERRWREVIATLDEWFTIAPRPNSVSYFLLALSHFQLEEFDAALLPAKKAVEIAKQPQQQWLQLLLAIQLTRKDYAAAQGVLDRMLALYPDAGKDYWLQLSALYGVAGDSDRARGVMELAHRKGLLTQDPNLLRLLQLQLAGGMPWRAAQVFEREMAAKRLQDDPQALELLGVAWILARDPARAEAPLARAAELAEKGDLYVRLAQIHLMQEEWEQAVEALRKGLAKGGLGDTGTAQLLLGIAYYNDHNLREARNAFAHAQHSAATREQAASWIEHIDRELGGQDKAAG